MVDSTTNETYKWAEEAARPEGGLHQQPSTNKYFPNNFLEDDYDTAMGTKNNDGRGAALLLRAVENRWSGVENILMTAKPPGSM